jgi:signal transduction histidine kinase
MQPKDCRPEDLFAQTQSLVDELEAERLARETAEADAAKSNLLAMVAANCARPWKRSSAMAELLRARQLDPSQRRYTETLAQSARSLLAALKDVLDFSMLEAGRLTSQPSASICMRW